MNEAIKLAIEKGGYQPLTRKQIVEEKEFVLSPLFWQALGKALGWEPKQVCLLHGVSRKKSSLGIHGCDIYVQSEWLYQAHKYTATAFTGGNTEKFWEGLLK